MEAILIWEEGERSNSVQERSRKKRVQITKGLCIHTTGKFGVGKMFLKSLLHSPKMYLFD